MKHWQKIIGGVLGLGLIGAVSLGAVISCSSNQNTAQVPNKNNSSSDGASSTQLITNPYDINSSVVDNKTWTKAEAIADFTKKVALTQGVVSANGETFATNTNNWMQNPTYISYRHLLTSFTYDGSDYTLKYNDSFIIKSVTQTEDGLWNAVIRSTSQVSLYSGDNTLVSKDFITSTQTATYEGMTLSQSVTQVPVFTDGSWQLSADYYACFVATNWNTMQLTLVSTSSPDESALIQYARNLIYNQGYIVSGTKNEIIPFNEAPTSAIFKILYSSSDGLLNYGTL